MNIKPTVSLTSNQQHILTEFIGEFLPPKEIVRRGKDIEIETVHRTIDKIFKKFFDFSVSPTHVIDCFHKNGYEISSKGSSWNLDKKDYMSSSNRKNIGRLLMANGYKYDVYLKYGDFIYINIDSARIRDLSSTTMTLPPNASVEKIQSQRVLLNAIQKFKMIQSI